MATTPDDMSGIGGTQSDTVPSGVMGVVSSVEEKVKKLEEMMLERVTNQTWDAKAKTDDVKEENMNNRVRQVEEKGEGDRGRK